MVANEISKLMFISSFKIFPETGPCTVSIIVVYYGSGWVVYSLLFAVYGGQLSAANGQIASPLYPHNYPPNVDYVWTVTVDTDKQILVTFNALDVEITRHGTCHYDYIQVSEEWLTSYFIVDTTPSLW